MTFRQPMKEQAAGPLSVFQNALHDFKSYLNQIQQKEVTFIGVSEQTKDIIDRWPDSVKNTPDLEFPEFKCKGPDNARIFIVDGEGSFFEGEPGALLEKILQAMGIEKNLVFICSSSEIEPIALRIKSSDPQVIITLGQKPAHLILKTSDPLDALCGRLHDFHGIKVMTAYHPSQLLFNPELKRQVWEDMKRVMAYAGLGKVAD